MDTDQLRLFLAIARHRSLSRAAVELELAQATVSERLRRLEREVGTPLFERQGRGVVLTAAGETFLPLAERALDVLRQAGESARAAGEGQRGQVTVAVTVTAGAYLFAPALVAYQRRYPEVAVQVRSAHSWDAPGLVLDGVAHLALISGPATHAQIESVAAFRGALRLVTGRSHALAAQPGQTVSLAQLAAAQALISYWGPASRRFWEQVGAAADGEAGLWMELSPVELVKGMLLAGTGVTLAPEIAVRRELAAGDLVALSLHDAGGAPVRLPDWEITLIRRRQRPPNAAADALAEVVVEVLAGLV